MRVLVLQHIPCETPGIFADVFRQHGVGIQTVELDHGEPLPDRRDFELLLVMGGPMGAGDETPHPWLAAEKRWIAAAAADSMAESAERMCARWLRHVGQRTSHVGLPTSTVMKPS